MRTQKIVKRILSAAALSGLLVGMVWFATQVVATDPQIATAADEQAVEVQQSEQAATQTTKKEQRREKRKNQAAKPQPTSPVATATDATQIVNRGIDWLVAAQHPDGGWGGGSYAHQDIRDPAAVPSDPATTAFAATALIRAGHTPVAGAHRDAVIRAMQYLVKVVDDADPKADRITSLTDTQPQRKLGQMIDTAMTAQFLTRIIDVLPKNDSAYGKVNAALAKCLERMERTQADDGSWKAGGGWAPVLQSAWNCNSLELAQAVGLKVNAAKLEKAREYQKKNVNATTGAASSTAAAGVELYAFAGGFRSNAADASQAQQVIDEAKQEGRLEKEAEVSEENLQKAGQSVAKSKLLTDAVVQNKAQIQRLGDENLLAGFGNNGGEEFLSYLMTSESLVIAGGEAWSDWNEKMKQRLGKVQNPDGSWSGHHCITSPAFCTAAALQVITTQRDVDLLKRIAAVKQ